MNNNYDDLSELEREFELEMEAPGEDTFEISFESAGDDMEWEFEEDPDTETEHEWETALGGEDSEFESGSGGEYADQTEHEFVERLLEIGSRNFESPYEADAAMSEVLDDIEREYFFGALKRGLKSLTKNKMLRSLAKKGLTLGVNRFFPGLKGALQLARGNVKGALLNFGKQALGSVVPGGGAMLDAVKAIGLQAGDGPAQERETWENYVNLSREAYEHLANNLTPKADQPAEAMRLANNAVQHAIAKAQARTGRGRPTVPGMRRRAQGRVARLRVAPGETIKLIIVGA
ncbi:MAG: hypothetical protein J7500_14255 [Sphingomonas sp.]|uniref:hypothetical protein n=1 Tax=Sphingomonas sp. TaxID=28214 RepID=UPI001B09F90A|nr:hypothetical protein [Sphingomonas sp.]MBO9623867.1 hypothetical protein [Sphingomonas sp.]